MLTPDELPEIEALDGRFRRLAGAGLSSPFYPENPRARLDFTSYDYLGLSSRPEVREAARAAVERYGTSHSGPRILRGDRAWLDGLERELAEFLGAPAALTLVSGFLTNSSLIPHLVDRRDLVLHDELMHRSAVEGAVASRARRRSFAHNDLEALENLLQDGSSRRTLVVVEGLYSMDGDVPDLPRLLSLRERYGFLLMVDEAHSIGVLGATGRGLSEHFGVPRSPDVIWVGTLSKALAGCGGFVLGGERFIHYLRHTLPGSLFSVGMPPPMAAAAREALRVLRAEPKLVERLQTGSRLFQDGLARVGGSVGASVGRGVVPLFTGAHNRAYRMAWGLREQGVLAAPVVPPAVPPGRERLRFFVTVNHTAEDLLAVASLTGEQLEATSVG